MSMDLVELLDSAERNLTARGRYFSELAVSLP